jgi:FtsZ-interacting cell division protein ZipA
MVILIMKKQILRNILLVNLFLVPFFSNPNNKILKKDENKQQNPEKKILQIIGGTVGTVATVRVGYSLFHNKEASKAKISLIKDRQDSIQFPQVQLPSQQSTLQQQQQLPSQQSTLQQQQQLPSQQSTLQQQQQLPSQQSTLQQQQQPVTIQQQNQQQQQLEQLVSQEKSLITENFEKLFTYILHTWKKKEYLLKN